MEAKTETARRDFQTQLKEVETGAQCGRCTGNGAGAAKPPNFDGTTSWAMFRPQFGTAEDHNCWTRQEKSTYFITALQGRPTDVLHGVPKAANYEETLEPWRTVSGPSFWPQCIAVTQNRGPRASENPCKNLPQPSNSSANKYVPTAAIKVQ
jgi:hypothetical protein